MDYGKLLDLLNEYAPYIASDGEIRDNFWYFIYKGGSAIFPKEIGMLKIISKEYGFIKWLVENEKIDFHIWNGEKYLEHPIGSSNYDKVRDYEDIIQWLSVEDEPIKFLCEILK